MATITGIGGIFFRAADPPALKAWYADMLGIVQAPAWSQAAGPTVLEPFPANTDYFDRPTQGWMINFRVDDLTGFIAGRSVWREVVSLVGNQRQEFLTSVALPRLERLIDVAERSARPWTELS